MTETNGAPPVPGSNQNDELREALEAEPLFRQEWPRPWMSSFLIAYSQMHNKSAAARVSNISIETVKKRIREDADFAAAVLTAHEIAVDLLRQIAHRRATVGEPRTVTRRRVKRDAAGTVVEEETTETTEAVISNTLLVRQLEAYAPEFRPRVEHTGDGGGPIEHRVYRETSPERKLELARIGALLVKHPDIVIPARALPPGTNGDYPEDEGPVRDAEADDLPL